jgi:D-proline reductase (dithiol) PrdA
MSVSQERLEEIKNEYAIVCCRTEAGTILSASNLEDPSIFEDLQESGLLIIPSNCLKVGEVLGAKLLKTIDSLVPVTDDIVEGIKPSKSEKEEVLQLPMEKAVLKYNKNAGEVIRLQDLENPIHFKKLQDSNLISLNEKVLTREDVIGKVLNAHVVALTPVVAKMLQGYEEITICDTNEQSVICNSFGQQILKIKIAEGKGIDIEIPLMMVAPQVAPQLPLRVPEVFVAESKESVCTEEIKVEPKIIRKLIKKHYEIKEVKFGEKTKIEGSTLYIRENICSDATKASELVKEVKLEIITSDKYNTYSETIMDVQPIATKEGECKLGSGVTRVLDGVIIMVTGVDEDGVQIGEFGSSDGILEENIMWNRPGAPDKGEIFIKTQVTIARGTNMERPGPFAAHKASDMITQEIREALKTLDDNCFENIEEFVQYRRAGKKKIVIVKEIMGQGAMHDNLILPVEPVGVLGGKPNVDLGNVPVMLSPLEVLDGGIHALTCIGPASKECSRHYFREPLVIEAMNDCEVDLCGVIFVGSPQINSEKFYVSERLGMIVEALDVQGAVVTTEGFGNNHIDFASHIEQIGMRDVQVVGMSFCGVQGALVVGNKYMKHMVDNNKSEEGIENEVLACNTLCKEDAVRALEMLKTAMNGEEVKVAERKWNANVKENNIETIEKEKNIEVQRGENETSIPMSEKRKIKK